MIEVIRQEAGKWVLYGADGSKKLGIFDTKEAAEAREKQIEMFKHMSAESWPALRDAILTEVGARHTASEYQIIEQVMQLLAQLHGQVEDWAAILNAEEQTTESGRTLAEAQNIADGLEAQIHRSFTCEADDLLSTGVITRDERIALSGFIGDALGAFSAAIDAQLPDLRTRTPVTHVYESARSLTDLTARAVTEAREDDAGNLAGTILVEGLSANRNEYTRTALESGVPVFTGIPIYADHPSTVEAQTRPERSIRDLVGRIGEVYVESLPDNRAALRFRNGRLSETAGWLQTLLREGIAGDMSINATGRGQEQDGRFVVEAFTGATSVDFVTVAAAGGRAQLVESLTDTSVRDGSSAAQNDTVKTLTLESLAEARPDIVDSIAKRERAKAYGEKQQIKTETEARQMAELTLAEVQRKLAEAENGIKLMQEAQRRTEAERIITDALTASQLPEAARMQVRRLVEGTVRQFVEQIKVPTIKLPPDVAALPDEAQNLWLKTYMDKRADGDEAAAMQAWSAVYGVWQKNPDSGEWVPKPGIPGAPMDITPPPPIDMPMAPLGPEALRTAVATEVAGVKLLLASVAGSGITSMGASQPPADETKLAEAFQTFGYDEKQAQALAVGRGR